ncbi:Pc12g13880 [Penicillium rubens Wisconsin 54-1255]|uniref:Pc12g13880 protein n=1 Tax=Penicillium rubens (strain ATCC 28089 / DSM 1075 / NRRL 1951 / Wisconsin 54-1255) TaxID=500485 RepID=B6H0A7_PENRW|nr:Pc12g13880 [Penicillium rubens Wisconsin 54-1255]
MSNSATKPAMGQKRPPRSAGRRRLDAPGEAILSEDRRSQIRRAQRTYRLKREASLQQTQKRVAFLEHKMKEISNSLAEYRITLQSNLQDTHCELLTGFDSILSLLTSASEDFVQKTSVDHISPREISKKSAPLLPKNIQHDDLSANETNSGHQAFAERSSTCITNVPDSYSFLESSFTRRLKRSSLEHAFRIFSDMRSDPLEVFRIFRLVPCFRDRVKMYPYFRDLVTSERGSSLEIPTLPFYCIGGAGTHYATKDEKGNPIYPSKMRHPRRILGTLPMSWSPGDPNSVYQAQSHLELCGFGGQWFDCRDVEGYLREKGVDLDGPGSFPTVHNLALSPSQSYIESGLLDTQCISFSETPTGLLRGVAILGRAPGFRRSDVETAFRSALMRNLS